MRIGIDLGGTKIEAIAIDDTGQEGPRIRVPTPVGDYQGTIETIRRLVLEASRGTSKYQVGVGIPGCISPATGLVKNANSTCLIRKPLQRDLETALGQQIRVENDANCFAISEASDGAGAKAHVVFGVILGTGVGGGLVVNGTLWAGRNRIAGEWGHNPLPWPGQDELPAPPCYCGQRGCIETYLSGPALCGGPPPHADSQTSSTPVSPTEVPVAAANHFDTYVNVPTLVELAEQGDPKAEARLIRYESRLARALAMVINVIDPDIIVLGGGLSNLKRLYTNVPAQWEQWAFSDCVTTELLPNHHGDSSGVRGAAWLWAHHEGTTLL